MNIKKIGKKIFLSIRNYFLKRLRNKYLKEIINICGNDVTIISSNCFGGRVLQDLKREYNTPTVGLYFFAPDYIEFLKNLKYYLTEAELSFASKSKYNLGNKRWESCQRSYPIGLLDEKVEIHFLHYNSEMEAEEKWNRRKARVNFNKLFIIAMDQNLTTKKEVEDFDMLPYENKIYFSRYNYIEIPSNEYMPEFVNKDSVGDPVLKGHIFYKHLVNHFTR